MHKITMATAIAAKKEKPEGFRFDAESEGVLRNVVSYVHNKYINVWDVCPLEDSKTTTKIRPLDSTPAAAAERIACEFEICKKSLPTALSELRKERATLSLSKKNSEEAKFFGEVIKESEEIQKKGLPVWLAHQEYLTKDEAWSHPHLVAERLMHYCECADTRNKTKISARDTIASLYIELNDKEGKLSPKEVNFITDVIRHMEYLQENPRKQPEVPPFPVLGPSPEYKSTPKKADPLTFAQKQCQYRTGFFIKLLEEKKPWIPPDSLTAAQTAREIELRWPLKHKEIAKVIERDALETKDPDARNYLLEVADHLRKQDY